MISSVGPSVTWWKEEWNYLQPPVSSNTFKPKKGWGQGLRRTGFLLGSHLQSGSLQSLHQAPQAAAVGQTLQKETLLVESCSWLGQRWHPGEYECAV
jgi:hypothetical protein